MNLESTTEALVEYDYEAQHADELSIRVGDTVTELTPTEPGWMRGKLRGNVGVFPDNFVKMVHRDVAKPRPKMADTHTGSLKTNGVFKRPGRRRCRALFSYTPEKADELALKLHDVIDVLEEVEPGWWKGSLNGKVGVFPSNFVEELPPADPPTPHEIKAKPVKGVGLGDILRDAKARPPPQLPRPPDPDVPAPQLPPKPVKELCRALFAYQRQNEDELTLKEGDIVTIVSKESEDKGWWRGEINGKIGVFPDNFVELFSSTEKPARPERPPTKPLAATKSAETAGERTEPAAKSSSADGLKKPSIALQQQTAPVPAACPTEAAAAPTSVTDAGKVPTKPDGDTSLEEFDAVERCPERLVHITADRARAPGRRPRSTVFSRDSMSPHSPQSPVTPEPTVSEEPELTNGSATAAEKEEAAAAEKEEAAAAPVVQPPWMKELQRAQNKRISRLDEEKASGDTHLAKDDTDASPAAAPTPATANTVAAAPAPAHTAKPARPEPPTDAAKPRKPTVRAPSLRTSEATTVPPARPLPPVSAAPASAAGHRSDARDLQEEVTQLQRQLADQSRQLTEALTALRLDYTKRMRTVLDELDAEKKARLVMQVQLDRLDKLVKDVNFTV